MNLIDSLLLYVLILIVTFMVTTFIGINMWSAVTFSILLAVVVLLTVFSPMCLMEERMSKSVMYYILVIITSFLLVFSYTVAMCVTDMKPVNSTNVYNTNVCDMKYAEEIYTEYCRC